MMVLPYGQLEACTATIIGKPVITGKYGVAINDGLGSITINA